MTLTAPLGSLYLIEHFQVYEKEIKRKVLEIEPSVKLSEQKKGNQYHFKTRENNLLGEYIEKHITSDKHIDIYV